MRCFAVLFVSLIIAIASNAQANKKNGFELFEEAERHYNENRFKHALALLDECLKLQPGYFDAYALRGSVKEALKDFDGALTDLSIYLEHFPENKDILLNRALIRYRLGFYEHAREDFHILLLLPSSVETNSIFFKTDISVGDKNPIVILNDQDAQKAYLINYLGLTEGKLKNFAQAKLYFDSAVKLDNTEPDYYVNRGLMREALKDAHAAQDYQKALELRPNHTLAKHNLAALKSKKIHAESPEARLTETIEADPSMLYPYLERALQRYESRYYEGAEQDYNLALEIDSSDPEIWLGRGQAREQQKNYKGAFSDYTQAIELKENFGKAWLNRGNVLLKMDRFEDAVEDYTVALIYFPDYSFAYYNRAIAKMQLKKMAEACADLKKAESLGMTIEGRVKEKICK